MSAKSDSIYFENLVSSADYSCKAAEHLVACLKNYDHENIKEMLNEMHTYEHAGDLKKHEMSAALARAFVTPIDREDLALISQNIDTATDHIEEVLQGFYIYKIKTVLPSAVTFAEKIYECCQVMKDALAEFINFKKPAKLHELIVKLSNAEESCDKLYIESARDIDEQCKDILDIISWREILKLFEECADTCEHVGDCLDMVVMKNS